ncbi:MAG TPA: late competence development ComFB family protein [Spongiibacteraceae bacterium]|jgi:hypothetical protein|nr:late competence development ComFB family protein [Spongiibacteraceae bacterium]HUH36788.1 late competence development ComFB family protein [Spongiibacteraceae bacterium]
MLLSRDPLADRPTALDSIHNHYEQLVFEALQRLIPAEQQTPGLIADIACVALNHLPPRYIRHDVDLLFYLAPAERDEMLAKVDAAVSEAVVFVQRRKRDDE